jgi:hypothetical protein
MVVKKRFGKLSDIAIPADCRIEVQENKRLKVMTILSRVYTTSLGLAKARPR